MSKSTILQSFWDGLGYKLASSDIKLCKKKSSGWMLQLNLDYAYLV